MSEVSATRTMTAFRACERPSARASTPARRDAALDRCVDCAATRAGRAAARSRAIIVRDRRARRRMRTHSTTMELRWNRGFRRRAARRRPTHTSFVTGTTLGGNTSTCSSDIFAPRERKPPSRRHGGRESGRYQDRQRAARQRRVQPVLHGERLAVPVVRPRPSPPREPVPCFFPSRPSKSLRFYDTWDRSNGARSRRRERTRAGSEDTSVSPRYPRARIDASDRSRACRVAEARPAPRPRQVPLRTSFYAATLRFRRAALSPCLALLFRFGVFFVAHRARVR